MNPSRSMKRLNDYMADLEVSVQQFQRCALMLSQRRQKRLEQLQYCGLYGQGLLMRGQKNMSKQVDDMNQQLLLRFEALERMAQVLFHQGASFFVRDSQPTNGPQLAI